MDEQKEVKQEERGARLRVLWLIPGFLCLALGTIGALLPILPTAPFYLAALFCFTRSSQRLHDWFVGTALYKKHLESYVKREGVELRSKCGLAASVTLLMGLGFFLMARKGLWIPCAILALVWLAHLIYFFGFVKTLPTGRQGTEKTSLCKEQGEREGRGESA